MIDIGPRVVHEESRSRYRASIASDSIMKEAAMRFTRLILARTTAVGVACALAWGAATSSPDPGAPSTDEPDWIHEDIEAGYAEALATGKPLLVTF